MKLHQSSSLKVSIVFILSYQGLLFYSFASEDDLSKVPVDLSFALNGTEGACKQEKICGPLCQKLIKAVNEFSEEINTGKILLEDPRPCVACAFHHVLRTLAEKRLEQMGVSQKELNEINKETFSPEVNKLGDERNVKEGAKIFVTKLDSVNRDYHNTSTKPKNYGSSIPFSSTNGQVGKPKNDKKPQLDNNKSASTSPAQNMRAVNLNSLIVHLNQNKRVETLHRNSLNVAKTHKTEAIYNAPLPYLRFPTKSHRSLSPKPSKKALALDTKEDINNSKDLKEIKEVIPIKDLKEIQAIKNLEKIKNIYNPNQLYAKNALINLAYMNVGSKYKTVGYSSKEEKIIKKQEKSKKPTKYRYFLGFGNNHELVRRVMNTREHWEEINDMDSPIVNFKWQQSNKGYKYERLIGNVSFRQVVNHFEYHKEITTKSGLIKNMANFCEGSKMNLFEITPLTFVIDLLDDNCEHNIQSFVSFFLKNLPVEMQTPEQMKKFTLSVKRPIKPYFNLYLQGEKKVRENQFCKLKMYPTFIEGNNYLWLLKPTGLNRGRGIQIFNSLDQLEKMINDSFDGYVEKSMAKIAEEMETSKKKEEERKLLEEKKAQEESEKLINSNGGSGKNDEGGDEIKSSEKQATEKNKQSSLEVLISSNNTFINKGPLDNTKKIKQPENQKSEQIVQKPDPSAAFIKTQTFIIQKYIEKPLLLKGRKFDIRVWVLVTHNMDLLFFKEGYLRMTSENYHLDGKNKDNYFIHLTNNAVQKFSKNYGGFESGNQLSFYDFQKILDADYNKFDFRVTLLPKMKEIIIHTMNSVKRRLNQEDRKYCFEIYGYDFIIDNSFNMFLLEVNTNPCIEESSPILEVYLPRMLDDAFKLTLDVLFPPEKEKIMPGTLGTASGQGIPVKSNTKEEEKEKISDKSQQDAAKPQENNLKESTEPSSGEQPIQLEGENNEEANNEKRSRYHVDGYGDEENMWELLTNIAYRRK